MCQIYAVYVVPCVCIIISVYTQYISLYIPRPLSLPLSSLYSYMYPHRPGDKYGLTSPSQWAAFGLMSTESAKSNVFVFPDNLTSPLGASSSLMDKKTVVSIYCVVYNI